MIRQLKTILSIAASDPMGGAGIQADIKAASIMGLHVVTAVTAVTVQNSKRFYDTGAVSPDILITQLKTIFEDVKPDVIKIGMLGSFENGEIVADFLRKYCLGIPIVVDPIFSPTVTNNSFYNSIDNAKEYKELYIDKIFPYALVATPNFKELVTLIDSPLESVHLNVSLLKCLNISSLIVTGLEQEDKTLKDILIERNKIREVKHDKIECENTHGTGCVFSSLLASYLALGNDLEDAFKKTSKQIYEIINMSRNYNLGDSHYGPLNVTNYKI